MLTMLRYVGPIVRLLPNTLRSHFVDRHSIAEMFIISTYDE